MAEYIEREVLTIENLEKYMTIMEVNTKEYGQQVVVAVDDLMYLPTADVVEVVRCKVCQHARQTVYGNYHCLIDHRLAHEETDYCSYGEKKEGAED